jgi:hypothetical protein
VEAAYRTRFYRSVLPRGIEIERRSDFARLPSTPITQYRGQRFNDLVTDTSRIDRIAGPYNGRTSNTVSVALSRGEFETRAAILAEAFGSSLSTVTGGTCAIVASPDKRHFAGEIGAMMLRQGVPTHVFIDQGNPRTYERLDTVSPSILVILTNHLEESHLPASIHLAVTFRRSQRLQLISQLDLYVINEFGVLAYSSDCQRYVVNRHCYDVETGTNGHLVVTSLHNETQPLLKLESLDKAKLYEDGSLELIELGCFG